MLLLIIKLGSSSLNPATFSFVTSDGCQSCTCQSAGRGQMYLPALSIPERSHALPCWRNGERPPLLLFIPFSSVGGRCPLPPSLPEKRYASFSLCKLCIRRESWMESRPGCRESGMKRQAQAWTFPDEPVSPKVHKQVAVEGFSFPPPQSGRVPFIQRAFKDFGKQFQRFLQAWGDN